MAVRRLLLCAASLALGACVSFAFAQSPIVPPAQRPPGAGPAAPAAIAPAAAAPAPARGATQVVPLDRVIAVVNDEALTQWDVGEQRKVVLTQMKSANVPPPAADVLDKQVLERLITERAIQQFAKETGIRVDDTTVERTIGRVAEENKMSQDEFRKLLEKEGMAYPQYREEIRRQILIQRVREREVENKVIVTDAEVDNYLATIAAQAGGEQEYLLSHIYVTVPEQATPTQIDARRARANEALAQVQSGKDFGQVAATFSDAPDALSGGSLGPMGRRRSSAYAIASRAARSSTISRVSIRRILRASRAATWAGFRRATPCRISKRRWTSSRSTRFHSPCARRSAGTWSRCSSAASRTSRRSAGATRHALRCGSGRATSSLRSSCGSSAIARTSSTEPMSVNFRHPRARICDRRWPDVQVPLNRRR